MCPLPAYWVPLILRLSVSNVGLAAIDIRYTIWFSKARNAFSPGRIDRLTCCVEPKRSLEAGALCVEVLVLLVLVPCMFECSLHGVHTLQYLKIEMGPSLVLQTYRCLGVCWVMPSWTLHGCFSESHPSFGQLRVCALFHFLQWSFLLVLPLNHWGSISAGNKSCRVWLCVYVVSSYYVTWK